jgi:formylglycine-generating enzyme required for sulfatase activity
MDPPNRMFIVATLLMFLLVPGCRNDSTENSPLVVVTVKDFEVFVLETGYVTDAEQYGWSIVQQDVFTYNKVYGATWRSPDSEAIPSSKDLPVTQVSYNDAVAYCAWSGTRLPSYDEYWKLIAGDKRQVVTNLNAPVSAADQVNILGNVWEITSTLNEKGVRLAGGSLFCSEETCHGTSRQRELYVDTSTGNIHIGFAVIR